MNRFRNEKKINNQIIILKYRYKIFFVILIIILYDHTYISVNITAYGILQRGHAFKIYDFIIIILLFIMQRELHNWTSN